MKRPTCESNSIVAKIMNALNHNPGSGVQKLFLEPKSHFEPLPISTFFPDSQVHLLSYSHSTHAPEHFSPKLVHGADYLEQKLEDGAQENLPHHWTKSRTDFSEIVTRPEADGLLIQDSRELADPQYSPSIRVGIRTADCLTWVAAGKATDGNGRLTRIYLLAHLGWRSLAAGLHWKLAKRVDEIDASQSFWNNSWHYLSPCIQASDYPCGWNDVGNALSQLGEIATSEMPDAAKLRKSYSIEKAIEQALGRRDEFCWPDIRKLALIDLLCLGAQPAQIMSHEINTARSNFYPSHRRFMAKGQASQERLLTLLAI